MKFDMLKALHHYVIVLVIAGFVSSSFTIHAQSTQEAVNLNKIPPRIIRACCTFGYDMKLWGVPWAKIDQVISIDDLGDHHYMGNKQEGVGTIYTNRGGFIDLGHMRDQIDWTRYLYTLILKHRGQGEVLIRMRNEAGRKALRLNVPSDFDNNDCILLAGKIAYDFSLWHEISTWYGASTVPFVSEKFSSFSVEDVYSNLLGIHIGIKTLHSKESFNRAATLAIAATLDSLDVVKTAKETYDAYDAINNIWYTDKKRIPSKYITFKRDTDVLNSTRPWVVSNENFSQKNTVSLEVPHTNGKGELLTNYYQFTIDLNYRIPIKDIFPERESTIVSQDDYEVLLKRITIELEELEGKISTIKETD